MFIIMTSVGGLSLFLVSLYFYAHRLTYHPHIEKMTLSLEKDIQGNQLKILHLSDLHMEKISISPEQLKEQMAQQEIDLIALTGDFLDRVYSLDKLRNYLSVLQKMNPTLGIYAVLGNHDYVLKGNDFRSLLDLFSEMDVRILRNESCEIRWGEQRLTLIGIDDAYTGHDDVGKAFAEVKDEGIRLVLSHDPHVVLGMQRYDYDYLLSGHFHGGQINWPKPFHLSKMGPLPRYNIIKGLHYYHEKPFYISEGLGQTGLNIRLRSRPEITFHQLFGASQLETKFNQYSKRVIPDHKSNPF